MMRSLPSACSYPGYIRLVPAHPLAQQLLAWRAVATCHNVNPSEHVFMANGLAYISTKLYGLSYLGSL